MQTERATTADAYDLLHRGTAVLQRMSRNGIRIDTHALEETSRDVRSEIESLEARLYEDPVWGKFQSKFGRKASLDATQQLGVVVFDMLGYRRTGEKTEKGQDASDKAAFRHITDLPFLDGYFRRAKLRKVEKTYLGNIRKETVDGLLHPGFPLTTTRTYRSSSRAPNFHNLPARDMEMMRLVRSVIYPRKGRRIIEYDLSGAEVNVGYCYHRDPAMKTYLTDPKSDMHRDAAADLFGLDRAWLSSPEGAAWAKKTVRDWGKNRYVFPQFYGSAYFQCAPHLWEAVTERGPDGWLHKLPDGTPVVEHLKAQGIDSLGRCDPKLPAQPGTFEYRVRAAEKALWERFGVYRDWKNRVWAEYQRTAEVHSLTGFTYHGLFRRNQVTNFAIQGSAFHVELLTCVMVQEEIDKRGIDALLIAQIHDSTIADVAEGSVNAYLDLIERTVTRDVAQRWPWVVIDLKGEAEVCGRDASWDTKKVWVKNGKTWGPKA